MRFLFLFFILFLSVAVSQERSLHKVSLQLHSQYQFQFAGFIVAKEKGYYKDAGLDVELKEYEYGLDIIDDVLKQKSNYGIYNSNILLEYLQTGSLKLLSSYFKRSALVLITSPDIKTTQDLTGKSIMAGTRDDFDLSFKSLFDEYDINTSDLNLIPHTYNIEDFVKNRVDAMTAYIFDQPYKLDKKEVKYNIINPSDFGMFNLELELFISKKEAQEYPLRAEKFRDASIKGWKYALSHQDEITKLIYEKYSKKIPLDSLVNEAKEIERLILPKTYNIGSIDNNFLNKQFEMFQVLYDINNSIKLNDFIFENSCSIDFNLEESAYLRNLEEVNVCQHPDLFPIDGYIDGRHTGIVGDIYKLISKKAGIKFTLVPTLDYKDLNTKIKNNLCDVVSILPTHNEKYKNMFMSKPIFKTYFTLVSKVDKSFVEDPKELIDKKLIVKFKAHKKKILEYYPYLNIEIYNSMDGMVKKVLNDEIYALVVANEASDYIIDSHGYGKLKINGFLAKENMIEGSIAIKQSKLLLISIIEKTLNDISTQDLDMIIKNWRLTRYHKDTDYSLVFKILALVSVVLFILVYYQRKLKSSNIQLQTLVDELSKKDTLITQQSKQAVMGEMISMIAHQWRQPLSTITLQISNLQIDKLMGNKVSEESMDKTLSEINESIIYLSDTIDDFKTYFVPNKKKTKITVQELLKKAISLDAPRAKTSGVSITLELQKEIIVELYVNEIIQVIINILNNALDAFTDRDQEYKFIYITANIQNEYLYISIEDNAGGIPSKYVDKLFEPYFSTKGKNGTGLGLYMSQMIIEKQFGGEIEVKTSKVGTTFIIKVPLS